MSMTKKVFQEATLSSNCPECYSTNSLLFTVYQTEVNTLWSYRLTDQLSERIVCGKCETEIFPVRYTDDIERVKDFYLKAMGTPTTAFKLKSFSYAVIAIVLAVVVGSFLFLGSAELFTAAP